MEGNRGVEIRISGEGVGVGGERERTEETGKERKSHRTHNPGRCKYDQRGYANIDKLYAKPSNLRRHIDWTKNKLMSLVWTRLG